MYTSGKPINGCANASSARDSFVVQISRERERLRQTDSVALILPDSTVVWFVELKEKLGSGTVRKIWSNILSQIPKIVLVRSAHTFACSDVLLHVVAYVA